MSAPSYKKNVIKVLNRYLTTALLSLMIAGFFLIFTSLILSIEQSAVIIESEIFQTIIIVLSIFGFFLITLGAIESIVIFIKLSRLIDTIYNEAEQMNQFPNTGRGLRIIRPSVSMEEPPSVKTGLSVPEPVEIPKQIAVKESVATHKVPDNSNTQVVNITLEDALQQIINRYNEPNVSKSFKNWQNTLMMTFPDLKKSFRFRIENDQGITLEEGYEENAAVQVNLDSDLFKKMMTKQINPIKAYSSGGLEVKGKMKDLLKLRKLMF